VPNWEGWANELVGESYAQGQADAREALAALPTGIPRNGSVKIYFSIDVLVAYNGITKCDEAMRGVNSIVRPAGFQTGVYAEGALIDRYVKLGLAQGKQWLSGSSSFPGFDPKSPNVCIVQSHDANGNWMNSPVPGTDVNTVTDPHAIGAWWPDGSPYEGDIVTPADIKAVVDGVWAKAFVVPNTDGKETASAAQFLIWGNRFAKSVHDSIPTLVAQIKAVAEKQGVPFDPAQAADELHAAFLKSIGGGA